MRKLFTTMALSAVVALGSILAPALPAYAAAEYLTVKGTVMLTGGAGNVEDVKITVAYAYPAGSPWAASSPVWEGSPKDASGAFEIPTGAYKDGLHNLNVTATLDGYTPASDGLGYGEDTTEKLLLVPDGESGVMQIGGKIFTEDNKLYQGAECPVLTISSSHVIGSSTTQACGGIWGCNVPTGSTYTVTPSMEGYTFDPKSITLEDAVVSNQYLNFTIIPVKAAQEEVKEEVKGETVEEVKTEAAAQTTSGPVSFYADSKYSGNSVSFDVGRYNMSDLGVLGNDRLSSLKVPAGYKVTLYADAGFSGASLVCTEDISFLGNKPYNFNDKTSSIVIEKVDEEADSADDAVTDNTAEDDAKVELFADANYKGATVSLGEGRYLVAQFSEIGNDNLSSLKVPAGYTVTLYEHGPFYGKTLVCTEDVKFLGDSDYKFNDKTSSIIITKN